MLTADLRGNFDGARGEIHLRDLELPQAGINFNIEDAASELKAKVEHLPITHRLFTALPASMTELEEIYKPVGRMTVNYDFSHDADGLLHKHWTFQPERMSGECKYFAYHVDDVVGTIDREVIGTNPATLKVDILRKPAVSPSQ